MQPYTINVSEESLSDLRQRLAATRWPDEISNDKWEYGTNKAYLQDLCRSWQHFDWRKQEDYLNSLQQFKTTIDNIGIHYIHEKGQGNKAVPLLLIHGWPDSFVRFLRIIPLLTAQDENGLSFDLVIPSIPGYGFSDIPTGAGMSPKRIASLFHTLMVKELGYEKFISQGGDWGGNITEQLSLYHEESLIGIHLTDVPFHHGMMPIEHPSASEIKYRERRERWQQKEGAYNMLQSTRPQTLAYGLNDSPAGLAAWIIEKFQLWTDTNGKIEDAISREELITNLTIYWTTGTINSSIRIYYEAMKELMNRLYNPLNKLNPFDKTGDRSRTPAAFALFPKDISSPPREFAERFFNVCQWSEMRKGGHFAAMEVPELLANDIRKFVASLDVMNSVR